MLQNHKSPEFVGQRMTIARDCLEGRHCSCHVDRSVTATLQGHLVDVALSGHVAYVITSLCGFLFRVDGAERRVDELLQVNLETISREFECEISLASTNLNVQVHFIRSTQVREVAARL